MEATIFFSTIKAVEGPALLSPLSRAPPLAPRPRVRDPRGAKRDAVERNPFLSNPKGLRMRTGHPVAFFFFFIVYASPLSSWRSACFLIRKGGVQNPPSKTGFGGVPPMLCGSINTLVVFGFLHCFSVLFLSQLRAQLLAFS